MIFLVAQLVVILMGLFGSHTKLTEKIAELRGMVIQLQLSTQSLKADHGNLQEKVDGISRHVAHIEGMEEARIRNGRCKYAQSSGGV
jgi:hypothetical protein